MGILSEQLFNSVIVYLRDFLNVRERGRREREVAFFFRPFLVAVEEPPPVVARRFFEARREAFNSRFKARNAGTTIFESCA